MSQPHSLMEKIPEKKIKYSKSYDNLNDALAIETETEYNEFGEPIGMKKEMSIQCSPEQMQKDIEESLLGSPGLRSRFGNSPGHSDGGDDIMYDSKGLPVSK